MPRPGNSKHSTKKKMIVADPEYDDWTTEELQSAMKPKHLAFVTEYFRHGGNLVKAYKDSIWIHKGNNKQFAQTATDTQISDRINGTPKNILRNSLVSTFIARKQAEIAQKASFQYENWINRMDNLSKGAESAEQYSPAIRAHELIGKAAGHIDSNRQEQAARVDDRLLVDKLTDILGVTADTLNTTLHGSRVLEAEDAEVIEPRSLT